MMVIVEMNENLACLSIANSNNNNIYFAYNIAHIYIYN